MHTLIHCQKATISQRLGGWIAATTYGREKRPFRCKKKTLFAFEKTPLQKCVFSLASRWSHSVAALMSFEWNLTGWTWMNCISLQIPTRKLDKLCSPFTKHLALEETFDLRSNLSLARMALSDLAVSAWCIIIIKNKEEVWNWNTWNSWETNYAENQKRPFCSKSAPFLKNRPFQLKRYDVWHFLALFGTFDTRLDDPTISDQRLGYPLFIGHNSTWTVEILSKQSNSLIWGVAQNLLDLYFIHFYPF